MNLGSFKKLFIRIKHPYSWNFHSSFKGAVLNQLNNFMFLSSNSNWETGLFHLLIVVGPKLLAITTIPSSCWTARIRLKMVGHTLQPPSGTDSKPDNNN